MAHDGVCMRYEPSYRLGGHRYVDGQMFCKRCERFIVWEGGYIIKQVAVKRAVRIFITDNFCPCCRNRLRKHARGKSKNCIKTCSKCKSFTSFVGKRQKWFTDDNGHTICSKCFFEINPQFCKVCDEQMTGGGKKKIPIFPDNGGGCFCRSCYQKTKEKKQIIAPILSV